MGQTDLISSVAALLVHFEIDFVVNAIRESARDGGGGGRHITVKECTLIHKQPNAT